MRPDGKADPGPRRRILIACTQERQSYHAGLELARHLDDHEITFTGLGSDEHRQLVEANGFRFLGLGDFEQVQEAFAKSGPARRVRLYLSNPSRVRRAWAQLLAQRGRFDLALLDVAGGTHPAAHCARLGVPMVCFGSGYASSLSWRYPPAHSRRVPSAPEAGPVEKLLNLAAWLRGLVRRFGPGGSWLYWLLATPRRIADWRLRREAVRHGARFGLGEWGIRLRAPEIAIAYRPLDWPALQQSASRCYLHRARRPRREPRAEPLRLEAEPDRPLCYFSMGAFFSTSERIHTMGATRRRQIRRYLDTVIGAFSTRPDWQLVMALVGWAEILEAEPLPPNVRVRRWVDQDDVLSRAAAAITAGGSASVHDCIAFGVPMLVVPLWADHFGNAARITYHGLGFEESVRKLTREKLVSRVARLMTDAGLRARVTEARERLHASRDADGGRELRRFLERHTSVALGSAGSGRSEKT